MSQPIEICIEDLDAPAGAPRYVRCVALPGRQPGLAVGEKGELLWKSPGPAACELWVSADARLILYRPEGASTVVVRRAGRTLEAPAEKPVVLLHEDFIQAGGKRMRVHVHGIAHTVAPPTPIASFARAAVAAAIGGSVLLGAGCADGRPFQGSVLSGCVDSMVAPIQVREQPPALAITDASVAVPGRLSLDTIPPTQVYLGNELIGATPLLETQFPSGRLTLRLVNTEKRLSTNVEILIEPGKTTVKRFRLDGTLPSEIDASRAVPGENRPSVELGQGKVDFRVRPSANVYIDDQLLGKTPFTAPVMVYEGRHRVKLVSEKGTTFEATVKVEVGKQVDVRHVFQGE